MSNACGGVSTFMTLVQNAMSSRCDIADACRRLGSNEAPKENEWYKVYKISHKMIFAIDYRCVPLDAIFALKRKLLHPD